MEKQTKPKKKTPIKWLVERNKKKNPRPWGYVSPLTKV